MLIFLDLILYISMKQRIKGPVGKALLSLRALKAKVFDSEIVVQEPNKKIKDIFKQLKIIMPSNILQKCQGCLETILERGFRENEPFPLLICLIWIHKSVRFFELKTCFLEVTKMNLQGILLGKIQNSNQRTWQVIQR